MFSEAQIIIPSNLLHLHDAMRYDPSLNKQMNLFVCLYNPERKIDPVLGDSSSDLRTREGILARGRISLTFKKKKTEILTLDIISRRELSPETSLPYEYCRKIILFKKIFIRRAYALLRFSHKENRLVGSAKNTKYCKR